MDAVAVVLERPERLALRRLRLAEPGASDVLVDVAFSGVSTGTERLLYSGRMPAFPGMGYPLVPGYESVGRIAAAGPDSGRTVGETVFVPGSTGFAEVRGLFGGAARRLVASGARVVPISEHLAERGVLLALAATAHHAIVAGATPDLVVGHGVLGRLIARIVVALGAPAPVVWELNPARAMGAEGYQVLHPDQDTRRDYRTICDASGATGVLDRLMERLARGGEIVLAGFYDAPVSFAFPAAFMREARLRVAAEWQPPDLAAVAALVAAGTLSLDGLVTHSMGAEGARSAYRRAFEDPTCLKMVLDWRQCA